MGSCCVAQGAQPQVMTWRNGVREGREAGMGEDIGIIMAALCGVEKDS